ncbi:MAG: PEGA domain-containing protein [Kiritimatiellae bacterium]|nr:PEGA domain-containing protein [Kiritimatiellia bacterium]
MRIRFLAAALAAAIAAGSSAADVTKAQRVDFSSSPEGAVVTLDGTQRGKAPMSLFDVAPGLHHVRFDLAGYCSEDAFFEVGAGGYANCEVEMKSEKGLLLVITEPEGCSLAIDGLAVGETPRLVTSLDVGRKHRMELRKTGYQTRTAEVRFDGRRPLVKIERLILDSGEVSISSDPAGARVVVDGIERGVTPLVMGGVSRGRMRVRLSHPGYRDVTRELNVSPGDSLTLDVAMEEIPGEINITSVPLGARIYVDGVACGKAPVFLDGVKPGRHVVLAQLDGYTDVEKTVTVVRGEKVNEEMRLASNLGRLEVRTSPVGASVLIDGRLRGTTTATADDASKSDRLMIGGLVAGEHSLLVRCHGYAESERKFTIEPNRGTSVEVRLRRVFSPNVRVETPSDSYTGELVKDLPDSITIETSPGVVRTFRRSEVRKVEVIGGGLVQ